MGQSQLWRQNVGDRGRAVEGREPRRVAANKCIAPETVSLTFRVYYNALTAGADAALAEAHGIGGLMKISVGNLSREATEDDLRALFEIFGKVSSINQRRQGMAIVDMPNRTDARRAIEGLNGQTLLEYELEVREMQERKGGPPRGRGRRRR